MELAAAASSYKLYPGLVHDRRIAAWAGQALHLDEVTRMKSQRPPAAHVNINPAVVVTNKQITQRGVVVENLGFAQVNRVGPQRLSVGQAVNLFGSGESSAQGGRGSRCHCRMHQGHQQNQCRPPAVRGQFASTSTVEPCVHPRASGGKRLPK